MGNDLPATSSSSAGTAPDPGPGDVVGWLGPDELEFTSPLARDYLLGQGPWEDSSPPSWEEAAERAGGRRVPEDLDAEIRQGHRLAGGGGEALERWTAVCAGGGLAVVAGQQPGLFGGPLYTLYKIATAVDLAARLEEKLGRAVLPVYLNGGDDVDIREVGTFYGYTADFSSLQLELPPGSSQPQTMVGSVDGGHVRTLLEEVRELFASHPALGSFEALLEEALAGGRDLGRIHARLLTHLFHRRPLLVVDGRGPALRRAGADLFGRALADWPELSGSIRDRGEELRGLGYHGQIEEASLGSPVFLLENGVRAKPAGGEGWRVLREAAERRPEDLAPGVALRPLLRDAVLPGVAAVLGPAEIAYHLQLLPVYRKLGVDPPVLYPRLSATYVPPEVCEIHRRGRVSWSEILRDPDGAVARYAKSRVPAESETPLLHLEEALEEGKRYFGEIAEPEVRKLMGSRFRKMEGLVERARESLESHYRSGLPKRLGRMRNVLRPRDRLQERVISTAMPLLTVGEECVHRAERLARLHRLRYEGGQLQHFLYTLESGGWDCPEEEQE
jgi:bacillithiol biosynthesis cysteine-adding enzyme BshC